MVRITQTLQPQPEPTPNTRLVLRDPWSPFPSAYISIPSIYTMLLQQVEPLAGAFERRYYSSKIPNP
jgi:hypothetical protein